MLYWYWIFLYWYKIFYWFQGFLNFLSTHTDSALNIIYCLHFLYFNINSTDKLYFKLKSVLCVHDENSYFWGLLLCLSNEDLDSCDIRCCAWFCENELHQMGSFLRISQLVEPNMAHLCDHCSTCIILLLYLLGCAPPTTTATTEQLFLVACNLSSHHR